MNSDYIQLLERLAPKQGFNATPIKNVMLFRSETPLDRMVSLYEPSVAFVAQRKKIGYIGGTRFVYDPGHYLVVPTPLALECNVDASPEEPFLAISIPLDYDMVAELIAFMDPPVTDHLESSRLAIYSEKITDELIDATYRLLNCIKFSAEVKVLGTQIVREIVFRVLQGSKAKLLFDLFSSDDKQVKIARSLRFIQENFQCKLDVESLANRENMSVSSFYAQFRDVTSSSPLRYIKNIRLSRARDLIVFEGLTNSSAAYQVGYESVSQFSREFKSYFGYTPKRSKLNYPIRKPG